MCNCNSNQSCNECLSVPVGERGEPGAPGILALNFMISGASASEDSGNYLTIGELPFDGTITNPFTALKANVYVSGEAGSLRIIQKKSPNTVLYENNNISSTSSSNIETATGLSIIPSANEVIQIQIKSNNVVDTCFIGSIQFYYTPTT